MTAGAPDERANWERIREAAVVVTEMGAEPWVSVEPTKFVDVAAALHREADRMEREAAEAAAHDQLIEDIAEQLYRSLEWSGCAGADWHTLHGRNRVDDPVREKYRKAAGHFLNNFDVKQIEVPF